MNDVFRNADWKLGNGVASRYEKEWQGAADGISVDSGKARVEIGGVTFDRKDGLYSFDDIRVVRSDQGVPHAIVDGVFIQKADKVPQKADKVPQKADKVPGGSDDGHQKYMVDVKTIVINTSLEDVVVMFKSMKESMGTTLIPMIMFFVNVYTFLKPLLDWFMNSEPEPESITTLCVNGFDIDARVVVTRFWTIKMTIHVPPIITSDPNVLVAHLNKHLVSTFVRWVLRFGYLTS